MKKETLRLLDTFIDKSEDHELVLTKFVPPLLDPADPGYHLLGRQTDAFDWAAGWGLAVAGTVPGPRLFIGTVAPMFCL